MKKPTAVIVFGLLNIVFGVCGLFGLLASLMLFLPQAANSNNPVIQIINTHPGFAAYMKFTVALGFFGVLAKVAAGIGLLQLQSWGRILSIVYAIYAIIMFIVGGVVNYFFLTQPLLAQASQLHGPAAAAAIGGAIGGVIGTCFGPVYPILLLIFMLRPNVAAAFKNVPGGAGQA